MKIFVTPYDELDPVLEAYRVIKSLYDNEASATDTDGIEDEGLKGHLLSCYHVPHVGLVDPNDAHVLTDLERYIENEVMRRLQRPDDSR